MSRMSEMKPANTVWRSTVSIMNPRRSSFSVAIDVTPMKRLMLLLQ